MYIYLELLTFKTYFSLFKNVFNSTICIFAFKTPQKPNPAKNKSDASR